MPILAATKDYLRFPITTDIDYTALDVTVSLSRSSANPTDVWFDGEHIVGGVQLMVGPGSEVGELAEGTWWAHLAIEGPGERRPKFLAGPFVITGGTDPEPPAGDGDYDGGEVT